MKDLTRWHSANIDPQELSVPSLMFETLGSVVKFATLKDAPLARLYVVKALYTEEGTQSRQRPQPDLASLISNNDLETFLKKECWPQLSYLHLPPSVRPSDRLSDRPSDHPTDSPRQCCPPSPVDKVKSHLSENGHRMSALEGPYEIASHGHRISALEGPRTSRTHNMDHGWMLDGWITDR